jgi:hypothetical protein
VWICEVGALQPQCSGVPVHFLDEVFHWLVRWDPPLVVRGDGSVIDSTCVLIVILALAVSLSWASLGVYFVVFVPCCDFVEILAKMLSQTDTRIITTRKHQSVEQIPNGKDVTSFESGGGAWYGGCSFRNLEQRLFRIEFDLSNNLDYNETSHNLSHTGDLSAIIFALAKEYLTSASVHNGPALGCHEGRG